MEKNKKTVLLVGEKISRFSLFSFSVLSFVLAATHAAATLTGV